MAAPETRNSVEHWQRVATRWKMIAFIALILLVQVMVIGFVLLYAGSAETAQALRRLREETAAKSDALLLLSLWEAETGRHRDCTALGLQLRRRNVGLVKHNERDEDPGTLIHILRLRAEQLQRQEIEERIKARQKEK